MRITLNIFLFLQFFYIRHVCPKISLNCLQTLNTSDCNLPPTNVFSYYKPGSRCELEVWRGCPTGNKFDTEEECSETCIFKAVVLEERVKKLNAKCLSPEDLNNCKNNATHGFKFDQLSLDCVEVDTNCPGNIFEEKLECIQFCVRDLTWDEKMKLISTQQSKELDSILKLLENSTDTNLEDSTQTTNADESKTTNTGINDGTLDNNATDGTTVYAKGEDKKLKGGDQPTTISGENKETDSNSTAAINGTEAIKNEGTTVAIENSGNSTSGNSSAQETTEKIITTMKIGTPVAIEIA